MLNQNFSVNTDMVSIDYFKNVVHLVAAKTVDAAKEGLKQEGIRSLKWESTHGPIFDQVKAQCLWLSKGKQGSEALNFGSHSLHPVSEVKWLGVWIDSKLLLNKNFQVLGEKISKTLAQISIFGNSRFGAIEADRLKMIQCVLSPRISYGTKLWATKPDRCKFATLASKVDCLAGNSIPGNFKTTASTFMEKRWPAIPTLNVTVKSRLAFYYRNIISPTTQLDT